MPKLQVPEGISVNRQRVATPQVNVSVTPEQLAGPEVRLLTELGKKADEVTDFVIRKQNAHDLAVVTQAESAMQQVLMERKLAANELRGSQTKDLLKNGEQFIDGNLNAVDGEVISPEHRKTIDTYQSLYGALDERQQNAVDQLRMKKRLSFLATLGAHENAETDKAGIAGATSSIVTAQAAANANVYDDAQRRESIETIKKSSTAIALINGEEKVVTDERSATAISTIHENAIKTYIAKGDVETAKEYLREHRKAITGDVSALQEKIKTRTANGKALQIATEALKADNPMAYVIDKANGDPDVFKSAMTNFTTLQSQQKTQKTNAQIEARDTLYDHIVRQNGSVDFENLNGDAPWGDNSLQAKYDSLPMEIKDKLKLKRKALLEGEKIVPELVDLITYERLARKQYVDPEGFKKINFGLQYIGLLKPGNIKHFSDIKAKMSNNEMKDTKDQLGEYFEQAGWTGEDNAPRRGAVRIEVRQAITKYEEDNDGRSPDDAWITKTIEGKMGNAAYLKGVEKKYSIAPKVVKPPKPEKGMTALKRITMQLDIAGVKKKSYPGKHSTAVFAMDKEVEDYKRGHGGQIPEHVEMNIARRIANDVVYQESGHWWIPNTSKLQSEWDLDPEADKSLQYVKAGPGEKKVFIKDLIAMPRSEKVAVMQEIARTGSDDSSKSIAETWMRLYPDKDIGQSDTLPNPGGEETTNDKLAAFAEGKSLEEMDMLTAEVEKKYGTQAKFAWTALRAQKILDQ